MMGNSVDVSKMTDVDWAVVTAYADNDMSMCKAADSMFYHRNSVDYHLTNIKEKVGLNPKCFYDLVKLLELRGCLK